MSRVSESSSFHAIKHSVAKTKTRLEDLQIKGSNLKRIQKPSDDPVGNIEVLSIRSRNIDGKQYKRNASVAKAQLTFSESAVEELGNLMVKAKELAIGQASNLFDVSIRRGVAKEIEQLRNQAISIANRRLGSKYIFGGFKSLSKPFNNEGVYLGDQNQTKIEVSKDYFVPVSFDGKGIFYEKDGTSQSDGDPLNNTSLQNLKQKVEIQTPKDEFEEKEFILNRTPAGQEQNNAQISDHAPITTDNVLNEARGSIFDDLDTLHNALLTDNHEIIQDLLPRFDKGIDRLIETRTKIGSIINSIDISTEKIDKETLINQEYRSRIEDADIAELFTDLTRQQNVLNATYKASAQLMNRNLMDYIN
jgi:flagellar hook-associated protein 3 FlgL